MFGGMFLNLFLILYLVRLQDWEFRGKDCLCTNEGESDVLRVM